MNSAHGAESAVSRRGFLRVLSTAATAVAVSPASALTLGGECYENLRLGFTLEKPAAWYYLSYQDFVASAEGAWDDTARQLRDEMGKPVVSIAKYRESPPYFSPSIIIFGEAPEEPWSAADVLGLDFEASMGALPGFTMNEGPVSTSIGGRIAGRYRYTYRMDHEAGETAQMETTCLAVLHRDVVLSFNFTRGVGGKVDDFPSLAASLDSIRLF